MPDTFWWDTVCIFATKRIELFRRILPVNVIFAALSSVSRCSLYSPSNIHYMGGLLLCILRGQTQGKSSQRSFLVCTLDRKIFRETLVRKSETINVREACEQYALSWTTVFAFNCTWAGGEWRCVYMYTLPFFRKRIQKDNITFHANHTVSYREYRRYFFEPSMSAGNESDVVTIPNMLVLVRHYSLLAQHTSSS